LQRFEVLEVVEQETAAESRLKRRDDHEKAAQSD
jgi:hypothetical protein